MVAKYYRNKRGISSISDKEENYKSKTRDNMDPN